MEEINFEAEQLFLRNDSALDSTVQTTKITVQQYVNTEFYSHYDITKNIKNSFVFLQANYTFNQNRIGNFETKTNDYLLLSLGLGTDIQLKNSTFNLFLTATNLLNKQYVAHLSRLKTDGIYNMGRNIVLGVNFNL
jgi:iron complex outermembrane receptor protein